MEYRLTTLLEERDRSMGNVEQNYERIVAASAGQGREAMPGFG